VAGRSFLDTNVLVYLVDRDEPVKQAVAERLWSEEAATGNLVLSTQVLAEFFHATTKQGRNLLAPAEAEEFLLRFSLLEVVPSDAALVLAAVARTRTDRISLWDALIVEAALAGGCTRLLTEDMQGGRSFDGLVVENPFRGAK
jgi:predicted nucleic acid-binding protein